ncbi:uncharacterized protein LOC131322058 isoform X3 [Rhododendron vialii]|uniref:uncharacterized protein LOC131322058 isoform X3 n=1 Tax=Rhododendron vialii TaxID=182163 RepID=UPI00265F4459|nr:uncharacterized protein LOC131322058 isoform X3 [Rhododendron vialii]
MAARAISLRLRLTRLRPITNPSLLRHFSSDSTSVRGQDNPRSEDSTVEASNKGNSFAEIGKGLRQLNSDHRAQKKENESGRRTTFIDHAKQLKKKRSWPELVGLLVHEAAWKIQEEMPEAQIEVVPPKFGYTLEFRYNRVRLHIDYSGKVRFAPEEG